MWIRLNAKRENPGYTLCLKRHAVTCLEGKVSECVIMYSYATSITPSCDQYQAKNTVWHASGKGITSFAVKSGISVFLQE